MVRTQSILSGVIFAASPVSMGNSTLRTQMWVQLQGQQHEPQPHCSLTPGTATETSGCAGTSLPPCFPKPPATSLFCSIPGFPFGETFSWTPSVHAYSLSENICSLPGFSLGHSGQGATKHTTAWRSHCPLRRFSRKGEMQHRLVGMVMMGLWSFPTLMTL